MKYKQKDKVIDLATGKECIVVGTANQPYKPSVDYLNRKEIRPDDGFDYLVMTKKKGDSENVEYSGLVSVKENQLSPIEI